MAVCVESSARLHLGFYNFYEDGVAYGGLGAGIEIPRVFVKVDTSEGVQVYNRVGIPIEDIVNRVLVALSIRGARIEILEAFPRHVGLGSTTQLSLSIAHALNILYNLGYSIRDLAVALGRGRDSGIGIAVFEHGGFIVDSGRRVKGAVLPPRSVDDLPQIVFRSPLPEDWLFIVVIPKGIKGLDEHTERRALDTPMPLPRDAQYELYKLLLLHIIPSVIRGDVEIFGRALTKLQLIVGEYFSKYQGGVFCCREVEEIVKILQSSGAYGVGQSSWGPAVYALVRGEDMARHVLEKAIPRIESLGLEYEWYIAKARNRGGYAYQC